MRTIGLLNAILVLALLIGCKERLLVLEEGRWTASGDKEPNFILYVSSVSPQRLSIKIDGAVAVHEKIRTPMRYAHRRHEKFLFFLPKGVHQLEIESRTSGAKAQREFEAYAEALDAYKAKLWDDGKGIGKQRRFAETLGGTRVTADKGERTHRGKVLNWHIQGTVADIVNEASVEICQREKKEQWSFRFPVHDSVYVVGKRQHGDELQRLIKDKAKRLGLDLSVHIKACAV